jgi:starch phosphorylase
VRSLPRRIDRLGELAYNLWWTWRSEAQTLFQRIDPVLWETLEHNPVRFLRQVARKDLNTVAKDKKYLDLYDRVIDDLSRYMAKDGPDKTWLQTKHPDYKGQIAYFSFEFGLHECLPLYAGGLGVLAGDHLKEASDLGIPLVGMGFMYLLGYFRQRITEDGWQEADYEKLDFADLPVTPVLDAAGEPLKVAIELPNKEMWARVWLAQVGRVPLYLLDADLPENKSQDRALTQRLYNPDPDTRIPQEVLLGIGGVRALRAMKIEPTVWHMNEGHPAFLTLERAREYIQDQGLNFEQAHATIRASTVFTTHTPVPAGNDTFAPWQIDRQLWGFWDQLGLTREQFMSLADHDGLFGMTVLALRMASRANGVSKLHGEVAGEMWSWMFEKNARPIGYITNGIHIPTWISRRMRRLYDEHLGPNWMSRADDNVEGRLRHPRWGPLDDPQALQADADLLYARSRPPKVGDPYPASGPNHRQRRAGGTGLADDRLRPALPNLQARDNDSARYSAPRPADHRSGPAGAHPVCRQVAPERRTGQAPDSGPLSGDQECRHGRPDGLHRGL